LSNTSTAVVCDIFKERHNEEDGVVSKKRSSDGIQALDHLGK